MIKRVFGCPAAFIEDIVSSNIKSHSPIDEGEPVTRASSVRKAAAFELHVARRRILGPEATSSVTSQRAGQVDPESRAAGGANFRPPS